MYDSIWDFSPAYSFGWFCLRCDWMAAKTTFPIPQLVWIRLGQPSNCFKCNKVIVPIIKKVIAGMNCLLPDDFMVVAVDAYRNGENKWF